MSDAANTPRSLAEVLAVMQRSKSTGRVLIKGSTGGDTTAPALAPVSQLLFDQGQIIDARNQTEQGDDLVYRLLATHGAMFAFENLSSEQLPPASERNIGRVQQMLLLATIGLAPERDAETPEPDFEQEEHPKAAPTPTTPLRAFRRYDAIPLPTGRSMAAPQSLDRPGFNKWLEGLTGQGISGYVAWNSEAAAGRLLFYKGQIIDAFWNEQTDDDVMKDSAAVERFGKAAGMDQMSKVQAYTLSPDFVWAFSSVTYGEDRAQEQNLSNVDLISLLDRLASRKHTGCVKTTAGDETAYIFMCRGMALGDYQALNEVLSEAPGRSFALSQQPGSIVDVYTAPSEDELLVPSQIRWPAKQVAAELKSAAEQTLGAKGKQVIAILDAAGEDPTALREAASRAKRTTLLYIGIKEHQALSKQIDAILARLP